MSDIKMSDVFELPVMIDYYSGVIFDNYCCEIGEVCGTLDQYRLISHAINSHDKLAARNAEFEAMSAEVISMLSSGKYKHDCSKIVGVIIKALKDNS